MATRSQAFEEAENVGVNDAANPTMGEIIAARLSRRGLFAGALATTALAALGEPAFADMTGAGARFNFEEAPAGSDENIHVAPGYDAQVLIRWGDPVLPGAPAFDPQGQSVAAQKKQFGYNNDYVGYIPLEGSSEHGLLVVNHEYTNEELMFPGLGRQEVKGVAFKGMTQPLAEIEMAAHGGSVLEIRKENGRWAVVENSRYARRIDADTEMELTGPAAGDARLKTGADPDGRIVHGMLNNCSGSVTPWGTWLSCEENINGYFRGKADGAPDEALLKRYGIPSNWQNWGDYFARFDVAREPNEPNRFGWVVEIDPFDPQSRPKKRTALGRMKHEAANGLVAADGRYVVYMGDDERFEYVYRFVSARKVDPANRAANMDLLDEGELSVGRFAADGGGEWLPLVFGKGPLTPENGFHSQADVVVAARRAGDLLGATKMDRPEDIEVDRKSGLAYVMLTNNTKRKPDQTDAVNPRANNAFGHIVELAPFEGDATAARFKWEILVRCGDPSVAEIGATFNPATSKNGWFGMPDNGLVDSSGRLWVATDGNTPARTGRADGIWGVETQGPLRGTAKLFFRVPNGAEMCGPEMTPDMTTFFVAVQHPGEADDDDPNPATFENPSTRWPDFKPGVPPRPSIVAITRTGGGKIGV